MTATTWVTRVVCALLALALLLGSLLALVEIAAAALDRAPVVVPHDDWAGWLRAHDWNDSTVRAALGGLVVLGLLFLLLALRRGKPASLPLNSRTDGVHLIASRRSVEKTLAAAAARTNGISGASASVSRRTARVEARTVAEPEPGIREEVEMAVRERLDSLGLERRMRTRVDLAVEDTR
jgi:glucose dehydrogenase